MCFSNAAVVAANLRDNLYVQPLIKEHSYAWVTSSKVPGGCGKGPASEWPGVGPTLLNETDFWLCFLPRFPNSDTV